MRRLMALSAVLVAISPSVSAAPPDPATATRDGSLINAFQVMCMLEPPNFSRLDAKAAAMQLKPGNSTVSPSGGNTTTRHKEWAGALKSEPFVLIIDEMSGSKGISTACAVGGAVADVKAFKADFLQTMRLPPTPTTQQEQEGTRSLLWDNVEGAGTTVILRDLSRVASRRS